MIVLDASAAVDALVSRGAAAAWVEKHVLEDGDVHAPHMIDVEVAGALRRLSLRGLISRPEARTLLRRFANFDLTRYSHTLLLDRVWQLWPAMIAPDGFYVALAEALDATLVTTDARLSRAPGHRARILAYQQQV